MLCLLMLMLMVMMMRWRTGFQGQTMRSYIDEGYGVAEVVLLPSGWYTGPDHVLSQTRPDCILSQTLTARPVFSLFHRFDGHHHHSQ